VWIPLTAIERVATVGGILSIYVHGKRDAWAATRLHELRNSMLLLEDLHNRGVQIQLSLDAPLPLFELTDHPPAPLPSARVHQ
jgi:hypothetical protein